MSAASSCRSAVDLLALYADGLLSREDDALLKEHLRQCPKCEAFLLDYCDTPRVLREATALEMPAELEQRLLRVLAGKGPDT